MDRFGETKKKKHWFKVRALYAATQVNLIVWGNDADDARQRAQSWQRGALSHT